MRGALLTLAALGAWTTPTHAKKIDLSWQAPPECPTRQWVLARVHSPDGVSNQITARAVIKKVEDGYQLELSTEQLGEKGHRSLRAEECGELGEVTAALLSLALGSAASPKPAKEQSVEAEPLPVEKQPVTSPQRSAWWGEMGARAALGVMPSASLGPQLQLGVERRALRGELGLLAFLPVENQIESSATSRHAAIIGTLSFCVLQGTMLTWGACLGGEIGALLARADGVSESHSRSDLWLAPHAAFHLGVRTGAFSIQLRPGVGVPLVRPRYQVEPYGTVFQPEPVYGSLDLLIGYRFSE